MKTLLLIFVSINAFAQIHDCAEPTESGAGLTSVLANPVLSVLSGADSKYENIFLLEEKGEEGPSSVRYRIQPHRVLKPGQCVYLNVPEHLRGQSVHSLILGHKANAENRGVNPQTKYDDLPALTSVQLGSVNSSGTRDWVYWNGSSSGKFGAKFAEPRYDLEMETLYEWYKNGYTSVEGGERKTDILKTDMMRVCSVGDDPVDFGSLELRTFPGVAKTYIEKNFGEGTNMGDSLTAKDREYGDLPGAITINGNNKGSVPKDWTLTGNSLEIPIETGVLKTFEMSLSDTHATSLDEHDDTNHTTAGWARLSVAIRKADGTLISVIKNENVPPRGVTYGVPEKAVKLEKGDRLVITGSSDALHILGLKVGID